MISIRTAARVSFLILTTLLATTSSSADAVFAIVGDASITHEEYDQALNNAARRKFYHGKPPQAEVAVLQREVGDDLVNSVLLVKEAKRLGLRPNQSEIDKELKAYDDRYRGQDKWSEVRDQALLQLRRRFEQDSLLSQLDKKVRAQSPLSREEVQSYYAANHEKFTEPERLKLSVILLRVDPSSPKAKWDAAREEAEAIVKRVRSGADFAALAKLHSGDGSAPKGGDMGYLHKGMLPDVAYEAIQPLHPKEISRPVTVLEGVAVFRLDDRKPAVLRPLASVETRARDLLRREQSELAWKGLIARLRKNTPVTIDESHYLPLAVAATQPSSSAK